MSSKAKRIEFGAKETAIYAFYNAYLSLQEGRPSVRVNISRHPKDDEVMRFKELAGRSNLRLFEFGRDVVVKPATIH